ncbi:hypothetical protein WR25_18595 [Diploscapter pachys]|uniref:Translation elongation factor EFTu/EF1A C-terminal domain-containing protein n=1 Tax=Diploscapter pachys TaxID=2018661 RepID=A0A2A2LMS1_9BILA|nr:hypothetical protein WR25_18595 [Diploscapter pachys]
MTALDAIPEPKREENEAVIMPIASRTPITGRGTVVVGTLESGILKKGDKVEIKGDGKTIQSTASDMQVFNKSVKEVGMWLGSIGAITMSNHLKAEIYLLSEEENGRRTGIKTGFTDKMFLSTWDQVGRFELNQEMLMPGEFTTATVLLMKEMPMKKGMTFTLRAEGKNTVAREMKTAEDELEDYIWGKTNAEAYLHRIASGEQGDAEGLLSRVNQINETLNRQLRKGVEENLPRLLEQTSALESLHMAQKRVHTEMNSLYDTCDGFGKTMQRLLDVYKSQSKQAETLVALRHLLTDANRCLELMSLFEKRNELVKRSEMVCEMRGIVDDNPELLKISWIKDTVTTKLKAAENEVRQAAAADLRRALISLNSSLVSSSMKALANLGLLEAELEVQLSSSAAEVDKKLTELANSKEAADSNSRAVAQVANYIHSAIEQFTLLGSEYLAKFVDKLARVLRARVPHDAPYASRLVQHICRLVSSRSDGSLSALSEALRPVRAALLNAAFNRLTAIVNQQQFPETSVTIFADVLSAAMEEELKKVEWDVELTNEMSANVRKCLDLVSKKFEAQMQFDTEEFLIGDRILSSQLLTYSLMQASQALCSKWPHHCATLAQMLDRSLRKVIEVIQKSVSTILSSMHNEKIGERDPSPYMQELIAYLSCVAVHFSHISSVISSSARLPEFVDLVIDLYLLSASIYRPYNDNVRRQFHNDLIKLLNAVLSIAESGKYGDGSAICELFTENWLHECELRAKPQNLQNHHSSPPSPAWLPIQLLISNSPQTLVSPHTSVEWTVKEYTEWCSSHSEMEILAFLNGLLTSYTSSVISRGESEFVPHYPLITDIIKTAMGQE